VNGVLTPDGYLWSKDENSDFMFEIWGTPVKKKVSVFGTGKITVS